MKTRTHRRWKFGRSILLLACLGLIYTLWTGRAEVSSVLRVFGTGSLRWILLAALLQFGYFAVHARLLQRAMVATGGRAAYLHTLSVLFASLFVNVVVPGPGLAGAALFLGDAAHHRQSPTRTAAGLVLSLAVDLLALAVLLVASLAYLMRRRDLRPWEIGSAIAIGVLALGLCGLLLLGARGPAQLERLLVGAEHAARKWTRKWPGGTWPRRGSGALAASEFVDAARAAEERPALGVELLALAIAMHLFDLSTVASLFMAFENHLPAGAAIAGYALGVAAWIVSPTPQGIGAVEAVMILVFTSLGVPLALGAAVALGYRGLTLWAPTLIGFVLMRRLSAGGRDAPRT
jgi:uncharacterized protein (TIRG00374 family)